MLEKITQMLRDYKGDETLQVTESTTFEELNLDSLDLVQLIMDLEEAFGVNIEMDQAIKDVAALIKIIESSKNESSN